MKNKIEKCSQCGSNISLRGITIYKGMIVALWEIFKYAKKNNKTRFTRKEIKHLLIGNENDTARFGDWVLFGGLIAKEGKGRYIINVSRCEDYFRGRIAIPNRVWKNPITKRIEEKEDLRFVRETPSIREFLDEDGHYQAVYKSGITGTELTGKDGKRYFIRNKSLF